jgi:hypothetical protein
MSNAFSVCELFFPADVYILYEVHDMEMVLHNTEKFQILSVWFNRHYNLFYNRMVWSLYLLENNFFSCDFGKSGWNFFFLLFGIRTHAIVKWRFASSTKKKYNKSHSTSR